MTAPEPKRPTRPGWVMHVRLPTGERWVHLETGMQALTSVDRPDGDPQWHVSISRNGSRCSPFEALWVIDDFDLADAEEDNHVPGVARHFWLHVDPAKRRPCTCKGEEVTLREGDYAWQEPRLVRP